MGRGRKGRDISGWLAVDKPAGWTSSAIVNKVRWAFRAKKAGHAGTLDPEATGVLAVALGEATKTAPYMTDALKSYTFSMRLGQETDTDDATGETVATSDVRPGDEEIEAALPAFVGRIMQAPPRFSAVRIDGERAYALARRGRPADPAVRPVQVESLALIARPDPDHATLELVCGKGGYVRAIARDLGRALGCHGHVTTLRRTRSGPFSAADSVSMDTIVELARSPDLDALLRPLEDGLAGLPELPTTQEGAVRLRNGNPGIVIAANAAYGDECWASLNGRAVAVGVYRAGELHPRRVFNRPLSEAV